MRLGVVAILLLVSWECRGEASVESKRGQTPAQQAVQPNASAAPNQLLSESGEGDTDSKPENGGNRASGWTHSDWIQLAVAVFTLGYLLATIVILCEMRAANQAAAESSAKALRLTRESNNLTRESVHAAHRPYLVASEKFKTVDEGGDGNTLTGIARVRNLGTTGANNVIWDGMFIDVLHGEPFEVRSTINVIPNSGIRILSVGVHGALTIAYMRLMGDSVRQPKLDRGETDLCFVCAVAYQDFFDGWHRYWFSYRRNREGKWYLYREDRATGPMADWFGAHMEWAAEGKAHVPTET